MPQNIDNAVKTSNYTKFELVVPAWHTATSNNCTHLPPVFRNLHMQLAISLMLSDPESFKKADSDVMLLTYTKSATIHN